MKNELHRISRWFLGCILSLVCVSSTLGSCYVDWDLTGDPVTFNISITWSGGGSWSGPQTVAVDNSQPLDFPFPWTIATPYGSRTFTEDGQHQGISVGGAPPPPPPTTWRFDFGVTNNSPYPKKFHVSGGSSVNNPAGIDQDSGVVPPGKDVQFSFSVTATNQPTAPTGFNVSSVAYGDDGTPFYGTPVPVPGDWSSSGVGSGALGMNPEFPPPDPFSQTPSASGGGISFPDTTDLAKDMTVRTGFNSLRSATTEGLNGVLSAENRAVAFLQQLQSQSANGWLMLDGKLVPIKTAIDQINGALQEMRSTVSGLGSKLDLGNTYQLGTQSKIDTANTKLQGILDKVQNGITELGLIKGDTADIKTSSNDSKNKLGEIKIDTGNIASNTAGIGGKLDGIKEDTSNIASNTAGIVNSINALADSMTNDMKKVANHTQMATNQLADANAFLRHLTNLAGGIYSNTLPMTNFDAAAFIANATNSGNMAAVNQFRAQLDNMTNQVNGIGGNRSMASLTDPSEWWLTVAGVDIDVNPMHLDGIKDIADWVRFALTWLAALYLTNNCWKQIQNFVMFGSLSGPQEGNSDVPIFNSAATFIGAVVTVGLLVALPAFLLSYWSTAGSSVWTTILQNPFYTVATSYNTGGVQHYENSMAKSFYVMAEFIPIVVWMNYLILYANFRLVGTGFYLCITSLVRLVCP